MNVDVREGDDMEDDGRVILGDFLYLYISLARDGI